MNNDIELKIPFPDNSIAKTITIINIAIEKTGSLVNPIINTSKIRSF